MSWPPIRPKLTFSLRSLFFVTGLIACFLGGRLPAMHHARQMEIERNEFQECVAKLKHELEVAKIIRDGRLCVIWAGPPIVREIKDGVVVLSAGSDYGIKVGDLLDIRRDEITMATVKVSRLEVSRAFAVPCQKGDLSRIAQRDRVISRRY
jgi:hypothetical protein